MGRLTICGLWCAFFQIFLSCNFNNDSRRRKHSNSVAESSDQPLQRNVNREVTVDTAKLFARKKYLDSALKCLSPETSADHTSGSSYYAYGWQFKSQHNRIETISLISNNILEGRFVEVHVYNGSDSSLQSEMDEHENMTLTKQIDILIYSYYFDKPDSQFMVLGSTLSKSKNIDSVFTHFKIKRVASPQLWDRNYSQIH